MLGTEGVLPVPGVRQQHHAVLVDVVVGFPRQPGGVGGPLAGGWQYEVPLVVPVA